MSNFRFVIVVVRTCGRWRVRCGVALATRPWPCPVGLSVRFFFFHIFEFDFEFRVSRPKFKSEEIYHTDATRESFSAVRDSELSIEI